MRSHSIKHRWRIVFSLVAVIVLVVVIGRVYLQVKSPTLPKHTLEAIPKSAGQMNIDSVWYHVGHTHVLRFQSHWPDLKEIIESKRFTQYDWVSFWNGDLFWGDREEPPVGNPRENPFFGKNIGNVPLYRGARSPPGWFSPNDWDDPNVYVLREQWGRSKKYHVQIIIYNRELAEGYLIDWLPRGIVGGIMGASQAIRGSSI